MAKKPTKTKAKPKKKPAKTTVKAKKKALDQFITDVGDFVIDEDVWTWNPSSGTSLSNDGVSFGSPKAPEASVRDFQIEGLPGKYTITIPEGSSIVDLNKRTVTPTYGDHSHECLMIHDEMIVDLKYYNNGNDQKIVGDIVPANGYKPGQISLESVDSRDSQFVYKNHDRVVSMPICDGYDLYLLMKYWFETAEPNHMAETVYYSRVK